MQQGQARIKQEMDNQAVMEFALEKAEEQGVVKGMEKERIEIAKNLLKLGLSTQDIMTATSMTQEQIEALR